MYERPGITSSRSKKVPLSVVFCWTQRIYSGRGGRRSVGHGGDKERAIQTRQQPLSTALHCATGEFVPPSVYYLGCAMPLLTT